jgi:hypothetical protein
MSEDKGLKLPGDMTLGDTVAAGVGALGGGVLSVFVQFADLGTLAAGGAVAGVTAKRAFQRAVQGSSLSKKAAGLRAFIDDHSKELPNAESLLRELEAERELWKRGVSSNAMYAAQLKALADKLPKLIAKHRAA